jgi:hypothetical protein
MTSDDLDRILASTEPLLPSAGFTASVMDQLREATEAPPPLPFPWRRFGLWVVLLAASAAFCGWGLVRLRMAAVVQTALASALAALASPHILLLLGATLAAVLGTYVLFVLTLRFAGARS